MDEPQQRRYSIDALRAWCIDRAAVGFSWYLVFFGVFVTACVLFPFDFIAEAAHAPFMLLVGDTPEWEFGDDGYAPVALLGRIAIAGAYCLVLIVLMRGAGSIELGTVPQRSIPVWVQLVLISGLAAVLLAAAVLIFLEWIDELEYVDDIGGGAATRPWIYGFIAGAWVGWLVFALLLCRIKSLRSAQRAFLSGLIAGSWLEFYLAVPVDLAARHQSTVCYCYTGSWLALLMCVPILVLCVGPALIVLFLRERKLAEELPSRVRWILARKSRRSTASGAAE